MEVIDIKLKAYRFVAYSAIAFSTASVFSICATLPMIYHFAENSKMRLDKEAIYCTASLRKISLAVSQLDKEEVRNRTARAASHNRRQAYAIAGLLILSLEKQASDQLSSQELEVDSME
ncbi:unnamed protein product [Cylicocyclus nassatus]|uniref:Nematode cuticle collagen N-terminal domain-containing protein n=1 Tax=Cylicocyclus nassatus TaxID=53992 RepID=A0AA36DVC2_CYLNA|nr:unnamed protein product [Cylicocyclus nassatus]